MREGLAQPTGQRLPWRSPVGHCGSGKWLLVSNYHDKAGAEAALPLVQELVKPMVEQFGMTLEVITEGKVARSF